MSKKYSQARGERAGPTVSGWLDKRCGNKTGDCSPRYEPGGVYPPGDEKDGAGDGERNGDPVRECGSAKLPKDAAERARLSNALRQFVRMYESHEAREDTVLFPAFRKIVSKNEYDSPREEFEKKEHELFGEDGFEKMVGRVAAIEKTPGIYELSQFTPKTGAEKGAVKQ